MDHTDLDGMETSWFVVLQRHLLAQQQCKAGVSKLLDMKCHVLIVSIVSVPCLHYDTMSIYNVQQHIY